jgi:hypothetical protein
MKIHVNTWGKLHKEELSCLYPSPNIAGVIKSIIIRWAGHVVRMGQSEAYSGFWWRNLSRKRWLGRPRRRSEDNIKMNLQKVRCGDMDWIELAEVRDKWRALVSAVMNLRVP